jgi:hypothetical protein
MLFINILHYIDYNEVYLYGVIKMYNFQYKKIWYELLFISSYEMIMIKKNENILFSYFFVVCMRSIKWILILILSMKV